MNISWQDALAAAIVLAALAYLARSVWHMARGGASGCGTCGSCPGAEKPLVSLDVTSKRGPNAGGPEVNRSA